MGGAGRRGRGRKDGSPAVIPEPETMLTTHGEALSTASATACRPTGSSRTGEGAGKDMGGSSRRRLTRLIVSEVAAAGAAAAGCCSSHMEYIHSRDQRCTGSGVQGTTVRFDVRMMKVRTIPSWNRSAFYTLHACRGRLIFFEGAHNISASRLLLGM